jgi:circadian clock protein KaiB
LKLQKPLLPQLFKGIAIFTPGGDLIYGIDPTKQGHWHLHLCVGLQELLGLPEPPHFLVPGYTAAVDRWLDPRTQQVRTSAELYRPVQHHQALLNAVFDTGNLVWQVAPWQEESCDSSVLETYRSQFPQLWEDHDLIVRFDRTVRLPDSFSFRADYSSVSPKKYAKQEAIVSQDIRSSETELTARGLLQIQHSVDKNTTTASEELQPLASISTSEEIELHPQPRRTHSYVLRLFVSGNSEATEHTLKGLHELLENSLHHPYTLKIIDVFKHPDQAEANHISATPTLLRVWPQPVRRLVGDLTNVETVLRVLSASKEDEMGE